VDFQNAVNSLNDVCVTCPGNTGTCPNGGGGAACTYTISGGNGTVRYPVNVTHDQSIQCDSNVTINFPDTGGLENGMFTFQGVTGATQVVGGMTVGKHAGIQGCKLTGSTPGPPPLFYVNNQHGNMVVINIDSSGLLFEGNTCGNAYGDGCIYFGSFGGAGVTNSLIQYNTFTANPVYGPVIVGGGTDLI
jgi:hypothetical protein